MECFLSEGQELVDGMWEVRGECSPPPQAVWLGAHRLYLEAPCWACLTGSEVRAPAVRVHGIERIGLGFK